MTTPSTQNIPAAPRRSARERLLAAADELFYEGGIHTVGIDRVIERAGVAKASLYDVFGSKEELVRSYLQARQDNRRARILAAIEGVDDPRERLIAVYGALEYYFLQPGYRGCAFLRAGVESASGSPVKSVCDDARNWIRGLFAQIGEDAGLADPEGFARSVHLLYDGASVAAQLDGVKAAASARDTALMLLDTARRKAARPQ